MGMQTTRRWSGRAGGLAMIAVSWAVIMAGGCDLTTTDTPSEGPVVDHEQRPYGRIPDEARAIVSGNGKLRVRAPGDGRVWIGNDDRRFEVASAPVRRNKEIVVDVKGDRVTVDGQTIYDDNLESKDRHTVFFLDTPGSWSGHGGYDGIPSKAQRVEQGYGSVSYTAPYDGTIWVGDDHAKRRIVEHRVRGGDHVEIDVGHDEVKLNGRVIYHQNLESKHPHSVFFQ